MLELADVAGPGVFLKGADAGFSEAGIHGVAGIIPFEEGAGEQGDIAVAFAQGGDFDADDVQTVPEVFAEFAFIDHPAEVAVGGGDDADIDLFGLSRAEGADLFFLEEAEEFELEVKVNLTDFVEEDGAAAGGLEDAGAIAIGAGEGSADGAEEFAFDEGRREGGAVDGEERLLGAEAVGVEHVGDQFLAGAGFAFDEDERLGGCDARDGFVDVDEFGGGADHLGGEWIFGVDVLVVLVGAGGVFGAFDDFEEGVEFEGFGEIVEGAAAGGGHNGFHAATGGHENDGGVGVGGAGGVEDVDAGALVDVNIGDDDGVAIGGEAGEGLGGGGDGLDGIAFEFEEGGDGGADGGVVFHQQQGSHGNL